MEKPSVIFQGAKTEQNTTKKIGFIFCQTKLEKTGLNVSLETSSSLIKLAFKFVSISSFILKSSLEKYTLNSLLIFFIFLCVF